MELIDKASLVTEIEKKKIELNQKKNQYGST